MPIRHRRCASLAVRLESVTVPGGAGVLVPAGKDSRLSQPR
ncbi:MAG TPA: hypothetical protein VFC19_51990 [Candidatus Limnocylindrales bacterium]|nr:hypothetical protein [Candidatus Limnocylindrales bacterium]